MLRPPPPPWPLLLYPPRFPRVLVQIPCSFFYGGSAERSSPTTGVNAFGKFARITITSISLLSFSAQTLSTVFCMAPLSFLSALLCTDFTGEDPIPRDHPPMSLGLRS